MWLNLKILPLVPFDQLGLSKEILKVLGEIGFVKPTEIQAQAIPQLVFGDNDFIGLAETGTGKTAAFGLPILERVNPNERFTQALVLAPTRELGQQIAAQIDLYSKYLKKINVLAVYGGAGIASQIKALRKPQHIIIATPGRLIDLIHRKAVKLDRLEILVLDEADEMLNMGFKDELDKILSFVPEERLTWLFSATMPEEITRIIQKYMVNPIEMKTSSTGVINENIEHHYTIVRQSDKKEALCRFLDINANMRGVVFCRTKLDTQNLAEHLLKKNYKVDALHGDLSQRQRDRVMKRFKSHELQVLIATDVAARGIDVQDLTHVFHYSLPDDNLYYTHRSGRTARAGKKGISIAFVNGRENHRIEKLEKKLDISFKKVLIPNTSEIADIRIENWCHKILGKKIKGKITPELLDKANLIFGNLSKEELIAKMLKQQIDDLNLGRSGDLNDTMKPSSGRGRGYNRRRKFHGKNRKSGRRKNYKRR